MTVTVFTKKEFCPYCDAAKKLLKEHDIEYVEIIADENNETKRKFREMVPPEIKTVPQIFLNDKMIGGYTELRYKIFEVVGEENIVRNIRE